MRLEHGLGIASDVLAFPGEVTDCYPLADGECAHCYGKSLSVFDLNEPNVACSEPSWQSYLDEASQLEAFGQVSGVVAPGTHMRSEIFDQWRTLTLPIPDQQTGEKVLELLGERQLILVTGAGGAGLVARQIAFFLRTQTNYRALAVSASELAAYEGFAEYAILFALSQSGETADTLCAIEAAQGWGMPNLSLVNVPYSTMTRHADLFIQLGAGPEHCVLSTKSATAQIAFGYWLSGLLCGDSCKPTDTLQGLGSALTNELTEDVFEQFSDVVEYLFERSSVFLLGKGLYHASAELAALNLKEATYIHAEAFCAGDLKHGVIALIESGTPVILFGLGEDPYMDGVAAELKSRGAKIIAIGSEQGNLSLPVFAGGHPVTVQITCQILAYLLALRRAVDPDRPGN